jgi:FkbM family methyltransferase
MTKNLEDIEIELIKENDLVVKALNDGPWENKSIQRWVQECSNIEDGLVLDIGSYNGIYSILASNIVDKGIVAFEPLKRNYDRVVDNVDLNKAKEKITVHNVALGDKNEERYLFTTKNIIHPSASTLSEKNIKTNYKDKELVKVKTLDSFIKDKVSLMKIDVEKFEENVLRGAEKTLKKYKPTILIELLDTKQRDTIFNLLVSYGYTNIEAIGEENGERNFIVK